jgi:hypothetical protein
LGVGSGFRRDARTLAHVLRLQSDVVQRFDPLSRLSIYHRKHGSQALMPSADLGQTAFEDRHLKRALEVKN